MTGTKGTELIQGRMVETGLRAREALIVGAMMHRLFDWAQMRPWWIFGPNCGVRTGDWTVRNPAVMAVPRDALPKLDDSFLSLAPSLVVEVRRQSQEENDFQQGLIEYRRLGVPLVWVVFPETNSAEVLHRHGDFRISDTRDGGDVLPGFACDVMQLFSEADFG
jgi:Uma2 family endonuclease